MKKNFFVMFLLMFLMASFSVIYAAEGEETRKIVSIVYDDSGSMVTDNNFCYSDYALQIFTASLGKEDELNIVRMSEYYKNNEINLKSESERQKYINEIENYTHLGGTPFMSVDTAKDWLINKSSFYQDSADYWLVVITDGVFAMMPEDLDAYFENLNNSFNNLNFEFVLLSIGNETDYGLEMAVNRSANSTCVKASNRDGIYDSILEISNMINNGASEKIAVAQKIGSKTVRLNSKYPLKKMMLLLQNTDNYVTRVTKVNSNLKIETYDVEYGLESLKGSLTHVIDTSEEFLNSGYYEIEFAQDVDMNYITFLCEAYVECKISIVDENDNVLNDSQVKFLTASKLVKVKCELLNAVDGTTLDINDNSANVKVELINGKNKYNLTFDRSKNAYYANITLMDEENNIYAIAEATDLFRIKSNVIFIDTIKAAANIEKYENELIRIEVPYSSNKEYKKVSEFAFSFVEEQEYNLAQDFELQLLDLPNGIKIKYDGNEYGNNDKIPMIKEFGKSYVLEILSNKEYVETDEKAIILKIINDKANQTIFWTSNGEDEETIIIAPLAYPVKLIKSNVGNEIDVQEEELVLTIARVADESNILSIVEKVKLEDVKEIKDNSSSATGFPYKIEKDEDRNELKITFKPNMLALFKEKKVNVEIEVVLANGLERTTYTEEFDLTNVDILGLLIPYIILAILLVILMGYVAKKKFNKKAQISITENGETIAYALKPAAMTMLIPYMAHKTKIGMIEFKAGKNSDLIYSAKNLDIIKIDGEPLEEYKETHKFNADKIIMKKDVSSITINAYDVEQKYEYLSKEVDMASGDDSYTDDYTDDYAAGDDFDSSYLDDNQF